MGAGMETTHAAVARHRRRIAAIVEEIALLEHREATAKWFWVPFVAGIERRCIDRRFRALRRELDRIDRQLTTIHPP